MLWTTKCNGKVSYLIFYIWKLANYDFTNATWVESVAIEKILTQKQLNKTTEKYFIAEQEFLQVDSKNLTKLA